MRRCRSTDGCLSEALIIMRAEKHIIRWVLVFPSLLLCLFFLPIRHWSGFQFGGIFDQNFLYSGAVDFPGLALEIIFILLLGYFLDYLVKVISTWQ